MVDSGGLVDVLFVPLVATLAVGAGTLPWLLSTGLLVFGGRISFCLYMVHELVHTAWDWVAAQFELTLAGYVGKLVVIGLFAIAVGAAALLFYLVEEPARRWMRRMVEIGESKSDPQIEPDAEPDAEPVQGKLRSIDGAGEDRPKPAAARAV